MRHRKKIQKLGRPKDQREALVIIQAKQLLKVGKLNTTHTKAMATRKLVQRLLARLSTMDEVNGQRYIEKHLRDKKLSEYLVEKVKPVLKDSALDYTHVYKTETRKGDGANMALLVLELPKSQKEDKKTTSKKKTKKS